MNVDEFLRRGLAAQRAVDELLSEHQLALRHPHVSGDVRATADRFLAAVRGYFADCPAALDLVRRGDDPSEDR